jgi:hypothetical protein
MATTPNYGWVMPDPTDFVTNLPADFAVFGDAVDLTVDGIETVANAAQPNVITTEGDLVIGDSSGDPIALPIGAAGTVLTSDGDTADWAAPVAGAKSYALLSTTNTNTGSSFTISGLTGYDEIRVILQDVRTDDTGNNQIRLQLNGDTTNANYRQTAFSYTPSSSFVASTLTSVTISDPGFKLCNHGTVTTMNLNGYIYIAGANASGEKLIHQAFGVSGTGNALGIIGGGFYKGTSVISNITLITAGGSFTQGTMYVYGAI